MLDRKTLGELLRFDPEMGRFFWIHATSRGRSRNGELAGTTRIDGYRVIIISGRRYLEHRLAWLAIHGEWPTQKVDHRDGNRSNNRIDNLRLATSSQNSANSRKSWSNSGQRGVHWHKGHQKWMAHIRVDGRHIHLGYHATADEAAAAHAIASKKFFGEFAP